MSSEGYGGYFLGRGYFRDELGIGVTAPAEMLDVAGTVQATGVKLTTAPTAGYVLTSDANGVGTWQAPTGGGSSPWQIDTDNNNIFYNNAMVGIGTDNPNYLLHVLSTGSGTAIVGQTTTGTPGTAGVYGESHPFRRVRLQRGRYRLRRRRSG